MAGCILLLVGAVGFLSSLWVGAITAGTWKFGSAAASTGPAAAITGGEPDGNDHPNVGLILFYDSTGQRTREVKLSEAPDLPAEARQAA